MSKTFVDTNILMYALQSSNPQQKRKARSRMLELTGQNQGVISTQILQEFFVASTKKLGVDPLLAKRIMKRLETFEVVTILPPLIYEAVDCSMTSGISFWDGLIVVAAHSARCDTLWTEDLNEGQVIRDVRIVNPLH